MLWTYLFFSINIDVWEAKHWVEKGEVNNLIVCLSECKLAEECEGSGD